MSPRMLTPLAGAAALLGLGLAPAFARQSPARHVGPATAGALGRIVPALGDGGASSARQDEAALDAILLGLDLVGAAGGKP